jgi:peptidoglycan hydrolase-like protein with peptidoglycan-binding domain
MSARRGSLIAGVVLAGAAITAFALASGGRPATATGRPRGAATAAVVVRTTLASREQVAGTLVRARTYTLVSQQSTGTVTELPTPGSVIDRGQVLYRLDGQPVRLLYGAQSAWRTLALGVTDGADVRELKRNLKALGFPADGALTMDDEFDWATAVAIEQWQRAQGVAQTGVIPLGSIAFEPRAVRVASTSALPGSPVQPGTPVLGLSSTDLAVSIPLDPSLRQLVHVGDRVQIGLPEGQSTPGRVREIGADATAVGGQTTSAASASESAAAAVQGASGSPPQGVGAASATVPVMISLDRPGDARGLDQVPVEVSITDTVRPDVLAVPIAALQALAGGGYAVAVDDGGSRTLIAVTPGIFDGNLVEVGSSRLRPGMRVEVPSS